MKLIIAGSRTIDVSVEKLDEIIRENFDVSEIEEVVSGCALGPDNAGILWARRNGIEVAKFIPDWANKGLSAGHIRNRQMGDYADCALVIYDGKSKGSKGLINHMNRIKKKCVIVQVVLSQ